MNLLVPERFSGYYDDTIIPLELNGLDVRRDKEIAFVYENCSQTLVEEIFALFYQGRFDKQLFIKVLEQVYTISLDYNLTFEGNQSNKPENEREEQMYVSPGDQKEIEHMLFCSWLLVPFFAKRTIDSNAYNTFWRFFKKVLNVNIQEKTELIVYGRYLTSSTDKRFWDFAEMYGMSKDQWLLQTIDLLLSRSILKLQLDMSYAIYVQVIAKDSLSFATKKNFLINLKQGDSNKIVDESPDSFINTMILEDSLEAYISNNPNTLNIKLTNDKFPPFIRYLSIIILDWKFGISADLILKTASDSYYQDLIRKVVIDILLNNRYYILADLIRDCPPVTNNVTRAFAVFKMPEDELLTTSVVRYVKLLLNHVVKDDIDLVKRDLKRLFKEMLKLPEK